MRESAEDLFSADPVVGEIDLRWPGVSLSGCELAEGTVGPGCVVVPQVFGQHPAQMVLIDDQHPVQELAAQGTYEPFADRARSGCLRAVNTASKELVNWPARSLIRNLTEAACWQVHQEIEPGREGTAYERSGKFRPVLCTLRGIIKDD